MPEPAPVAVFAYRRPEHLRRVLRSLAANDLAAKSVIHVFCDGPRGAEDGPAVHATREVARETRGFAGVTVHEQAGNCGLASSIIGGVNWMLERTERVIVVEDDILVGPYFLRYMNEALTVYANDTRVASIHGYIEADVHHLPETFFLAGAECWGWATWRRAWACFEADGRKLLEELEARGLERDFDLDGSYPFTRMLRDQIVGLNDSWAIRWHASAYLRGMLTLYPGRTLVENIGHDGSGTHCADEARSRRRPSQTPVRIERQALAPCAEARRAIADTYRRQQRLASRLAMFFRQMAVRLRGPGRSS